MLRRAVGRLAGMTAAVLAALPAAADTQYVWWEGEAPAETNFPRQSWFSASTFADRRHLLSGGDWLSHSGKRTGTEAFATYRVDAPADGEYNLWARKFWKHGPFRWRFDKAEWRTCTRDVALADNVPLRKHVCANWVFLGKVKLSKGARTFELRLSAKQGEELTAAFDCFLLSPGLFIPNGRHRPGQRTGLADEGFFAFEPPVDAFSRQAVLDLRHLNEAAAGQDGFVARRQDAFVLGGGRPVRFWAVNVSANNAGQDRASVDYLARKLAKLGANMVRYHSALFDARGDVANLDARKLDDLFYLVAAMKKQGIYTKISFYFPLWFAVRPAYGIAGYEGFANAKPFTLLYHDERMQQIYKSWARKLLTTPNPYTGAALASEPAVAIVEVVNEDSLFFWTFSKRMAPPAQMRRLEKLFGAHLAGRHGSLAAALRSWPAAAHPDDSVADGRAGLFEAWHMTGAGLRNARPDKVRRVSEQVRFLAEHQRRFYASIRRYFREDLGCRGLVSASNWKTADAALLDALERHTYTACDVIDRHGYFGGKHAGEGASYSVRVGHAYADRAAVTAPEALPIQAVQSAGFPQIISELGWTNPNRYRADCTLLAAAYGALQGIDGLFLFATGSNALRDLSMQKFALSCPVIAWTFPAAALMYRRGDVAEAPEAIRQEIAIEDLYALKGSGSFSAAAYDALRQKDVPAEKAPATPAAHDPLAFYVGKVVRAVGDGPTRTRQADLAGCIDRRKRTIKSLTRQLEWDYGRGVVTVNTGRSQAATGFLGRAGAIELADVKIDCDNEYASIMVVSLDGRDLAESGKVLIQAMTEERPYGFKAARGKIVDLGGPPFGVRKIAATVALRGRAEGLRVRVLDENGCDTGKPAVAAAIGKGGWTSIRLASDAIYHVVERPAVPAPGPPRADSRPPGPTGR